MQLIAGGNGQGGALDCENGGLREQQLAQPVAKGYKELQAMVTPAPSE